MKRMVVIFYILSLFLFTASLSTLAEEEAIDLTQIKRLHIQVESGEIFFDAESPDILLSPELKVEKEGDLLYIQSTSPSLPFFWGGRENHSHLRIGTQLLYDEMVIQADKVVISGTVKTRYLSLQGGSLQINDLTVEGERVEIKGAGLNIRGHYQVKNIDLQGVGMNIQLQVQGTEQIKLNAVGIQAQIHYTAGWIGERSIEIQSLGGTLAVEVPKKTGLSEDGYLKIRKSPLVNILLRTYEKE